MWQCIFTLNTRMFVEAAWQSLLNWNKESPFEWRFGRRSNDFIANSLLCLTTAERATFLLVNEGKC